MLFHQVTIDALFDHTVSRPSGLTAAEARKRLAEAGSNQLVEAPKRPLALVFFGQFKDVLILVLLGAAAISLLIGDVKDTIVILIIVLLNAVLGFVQEWRAGKAMQALRQMAAAQALVVRDGEAHIIDATKLVPGDVVLLEAGNAVPADLRVVASVNLRVEEAALTGESDAVDKTTTPIADADLPVADRTNMMYKGTFVSYGRGTGLVVATGMNTELGRIARMLQQEESATPLQVRMAAFGKRLSVLVLALCIVFFVVGWLQGADFFRMLMTSISLAVAAIPEALPAVITISLALAARRMARLKSLVRKLPAVETLGSVTYICTDKTGTLTRNKMYVEQVYADGAMRARSDFDADESPRVLFLKQAFALNNDTALRDGVRVGESTEMALMEASGPALHTADHPRLAEIAFDSDRKLMTTFHTWEGRVLAITKGAPDILLQRCAKDETQMQPVVDAMASEGLRVMGFACRWWDVLPDERTAANVERELQFIGLAGLIDPPRAEVFEAVAQSRTAGIVPVMITGDHPLTARSIASRIGIIQSEADLVATGADLAEMDAPTLEQRVERIRVFARVSPEQKLDIVKALQKQGHFVAMTGDGVNDAPSLRRANIGIAMGITGTDVSREAAHMILLDDNFSTIVKAVGEGRRIYDNILKFIKYLMTTNAGELLVLLLGPLLGLPIALLPIHILWINLISDGLPAITLSFEKAEADVMLRPPRPPREPIFSKGRGAHIVWVGMLMAAIVLGMQSFAIARGLHWQTMVFNMMCLTEMWHLLAIRSEKQSLFRIGIFSNRPLIASVVLSFALQALVTYVPLLQSVFHTEALTFFEFISVGVFPAIVFLAVEIEKAIKRRRGMRSPIRRVAARPSAGSGA